MRSRYDRFFVYSTLLLLLSVQWGCQNRKNLVDEKLYDGPTLSMDSIYTKMSDSAKVLVRLRAAKQLNLENGDQEWPEGLYLEYLDKEGQIVSTFKADFVHYSLGEDIYRAEGNVVVNNIEDGDELNTEELFWSPRQKEFYTDRFVTIKSEDEVHTGEGLRADEDFSSYKIIKPQGTLLLEEE